MKKLMVALFMVSTVVAFADSPVPTGSRLCIEADPEVQSLVQAALLKKQVPIVLLAECDATAFKMIIPRYEQNTEKQGVAIAKMVLGFRSGNNFQMDATVSNPEGVIVFAKTVKRRDKKVAAQDLAKWFGEFVKTGKIK